MELPEPERVRLAEERVRLAVSVKQEEEEMIERFGLSTRDDLELFGRVFCILARREFAIHDKLYVRRNNLDVIHNIISDSGRCNPRL